MGRRPAGGPPPAVPQAGARRRATTPKGRTLGRAARRRLRAAHRPHQRRPGRRRGVRGDGHDPRPHRTSRRWSPRDPSPMDKLRSTCPSPTPTGSGRRSPTRAPARSATTTPRRSATPGEGRFRPLAGANPAVGEVGRLEVVDEVRVEVVLAAPAACGRRRRDAGGPSLRGAGVRRRRARRPAAPAGTGSGRIGDVEPTTLGDFARAVADGCRRPPQGVRVAGDPDRPYAGWRCAAARATSCSTRCSPPTPTSTSPATCGTTRRGSSWSRTGRRWSTSRTGRPSGPGCRWWRRECRRHWAIRWRPG